MVNLSATKVPFSLAWMEEAPKRKRKRVYSFEPNEALRGNFLQNYMNYLLPALLRINRDISDCGDEDREKEQIIRYEVDMAMALSARGFKWSHALKKNLERDMKMKSPHNKHNHILNLPLPTLPRPLVPTSSQGNPNPNPSFEYSIYRARTFRRRRRSKRSKNGEDKELGSRLTNLRRILPGGDEMGMLQLLCEVESYVISLELQVSILEALTNE